MKYFYQFLLPFFSSSIPYFQPFFPSSTPHFQPFFPLSIPYFQLFFGFGVNSCPTQNEAGVTAKTEYEI